MRDNQVKHNVTTTKKKGNVIINPKKEDLMSESLRKIVRSEVESLKESAKKKAKNIKAAKAGKRWQDSDGDGKWYEPGQDVKKEECDAPAAKVDDTDAKKKAKDRMKQKMMQMTQDHDDKAAGKSTK
jgi:hypothetical protein